MIIEIVALKSSVSGCKISFVSHGSYFQQSGLLAFRIIFISWAMTSHTEQKHLVSLRIDYSFMTTYGFGISFHNSHTVIILIFDIVHILLK